MQYTFSNFLAVRDLIIQNSILNQILAAYLSDRKEPIVVGKALKKLEGKLRNQVRKEKGDKLPNYIMADIVISLDKACKIGYSYEHYPTIWTSQREKPPFGNVTHMKAITNIIIQAYSFNAAHTDKIFSKLPKSLSNLLEINKISPNYWKTGFSKPIPKGTGKIVVQSELAEPYTILYRRLADWRIFNKILISIMKKGFVEMSNPKFGLLKVYHEPGKDQIRFYFNSYIDDSNFSVSVSCFDLTPERWEAQNYSIDIFTLRNIFSVG